MPTGSCDAYRFLAGKSQGIPKMVSGFKYYSKRGMGLAMSAEELIKVNTCRVGKFYDNTTPMLPLLESPGLRIIDPTKDGDGYWKYEKIANPPTLFFL